jgi:hypothetical protein
VFAPTFDFEHSITPLQSCRRFHLLQIMSHTVSKMRSTMSRAGERALIASGDMTTWIPHAFGGDRIIQPPTSFNVTAYLKPGGAVGNSSSSNSSMGGSVAQSLLVRPVPPTATQVGRALQSLSFTTAGNWAAHQQQAN